MTSRLEVRLTLQQKKIRIMAKMKHFTLEELTKSQVAARLKIDNTPPEEARKQLVALVTAVLDPLREAWGGPVTVTSGYRCKALNAAVGGVANSQHMLGQAADITVGSQADNERLMAVLKRLGLPVDQVIGEHGFRWIHVSHGPRNRKQYLTIC